MINKSSTFCFEKYVSKMVGAKFGLQRFKRDNETKDGDRDREKTPKWLGSTVPGGGVHKSNTNLNSENILAISESTHISL